MKPTSTSTGAPAVRPRNYWELTDEQVAEAISEWLKSKGAEIGDDMYVHYPDRNRPFRGDEKLKFSAHLT